MAEEAKKKDNRESVLYVSEMMTLHIESALEDGQVAKAYDHLLDLQKYIKEQQDMNS